MGKSGNEVAARRFGWIERSSRALTAALWPLAPGHLLAMLLGILPVALLVTIIEWQREIVPDSEVVRFEVALSGLVPVA